MLKLASLYGPPEAYIVNNRKPGVSSVPVEAAAVGQVGAGPEIPESGDRIM